MHQGEPPPLLTHVLSTAATALCCRHGARPPHISLPKRTPTSMSPTTMALSPLSPPLTACRLPSGPRLSATGLNTGLHPPTHRVHEEELVVLEVLRRGPMPLLERPLLNLLHNLRAPISAEQQQARQDDKVTACLCRCVRHPQELAKAPPPQPRTSVVSMFLRHAFLPFLDLAVLGGPMAAAGCRLGEQGLLVVVGGGSKAVDCGRGLGGD